MRVVALGFMLRRSGSSFNMAHLATVRQLRPSLLKPATPAGSPVELAADASAVQVVDHRCYCLMLLQFR
jgi:hypothetical protein